MGGRLQQAAGEHSRGDPGREVVGRELPPSALPFELVALEALMGTSVKRKRQQVDECTVLAKRILRNIRKNLSVSLLNRYPFRSRCHALVLRPVASRGG